VAELSQPFLHAYLTPPEIGRRLRVTPERVIGWIKSGQLRACNVGDGAIRPRWRIAAADLETFLAARGGHTGAQDAKAAPIKAAGHYRVLQVTGKQPARRPRKPKG
jgi:hypothetical protein